MPATKFTAETRKMLLEALQFGSSRNTACALARLDPSALSRWMAKGKDAAEGGQWRKFYEDVLAAEAALPMRALGVIWNAVPDDPKLAFKVLERREPIFAPPMPSVPAPMAGPIVIQLGLSGGSSLALPSPVIEGEVVDESDITTGEDAAEPAPVSSA